MTNAQLYLTIGIPIIVNIIFNGFLLGIMWSSIDRRINRIEDKVDLLTGKVIELMTKIDK